MADIELKDLAHSYDGKHQALKYIDHIWKQGGAYALLGPSGCGKSTLLNIISGLLAPSSGEVLFDGQEVTSLSPQARNIAQVFQFPVVYDAMTVRENLAFPLKNIKLPKQKIDAQVTKIAKLLELEKQLDKKAKALSADEKQKISMGRGLVREDVSAILFDEPLTVIDPHLKWKLRRKLKEIHQQLDITMIYVTHDQLEAATFADEIAVMYQGNIVQFGTPQSLFDKPNHTFVGYFIGSPGMNFVNVAWQNMQLKAHGQVFSISSNQRKALNVNYSSNIKLGIRPEHINIVKHPNENTISANFLFAEALGSHQIITVEALGQQWFIRVDEEQSVTPGALYLELPPQHRKLYIDEYLQGENEGGPT